MDESVLRAMARWPDVPAVFGWLRLDRRGRWLIRGETIANEAARSFIARNYAADEQGRWYFQNGPQRVFVTLEAAPWVLRLHEDGRLTTHAGTDPGAPHAAFMDEHGDVTLDTTVGPGLLDDRDLEAFSECLCGRDGSVLSQEVLIRRLDAMSSGERTEVHVALGVQRLPLVFLSRSCAPRRLGFVRDPESDAGKA